MFYLQIFITSFLITLVITPFVIRHFIAVGIVDKPNKRKVHKSVIPRMGGVIVFIISILVFISFYKELENYRIFLLSSFIIAIIGNLDDVFSLRWSHKLFAQTAVASFITFDIFTRINELTLFGIILPEFIAVLLLIVFIVGILNAVNFLDGLDGLVCGYSIISLAIILFLGYSSGNEFIIILSAGILGSLLGFMKFNTYPARIFLGDTGSLSLAFFLSYLVLVTSIEQTQVKESIDFTFVLIFFALPITDTLKVIFKRVSTGKSPFEADKNHLHHKIIGLEVRQKISTFIIHLFSILFVSLAFLYFDSKSEYVIYATFALIVVVLLIPKIVYYFRGWFFTITHQIKRIPTLGVKAFFIVFPISACLSIILLLVPLITISSNFDRTELLYIIVLYLILFIISYNRTKSADSLNHLFVFFNIIIFTSLFELTNFTQKLNLVLFSISKNYLFYFGIILTFSIVIYFVYVRDRMNFKNASLFYGQDLILIVILILVFIAKDIVNNPLLEKVNIIFLSSFSIYTIYIIAIKLYPKRESLLYTLSFLLPVSSTIVLLFYN